MKKAALVFAIVVLAALPALADDRPMAAVQGTPPSVSLSWTQSVIPAGATCPSGTGSTAITGNNVYRSTTSGAEGATPYAKLATPATTYTDTGVTAGATYYYKVTGINCSGESAQSAESNPAIIPNPLVPAAPTGLTITSVTAGLVLEWNPVMDAANGSMLRQSVYYNVYRCQTDLNPCNKTTQILLNPSPVICTAYFDSQLTSKSHYAYWVQATTLTYGSAWSAGAAAVAP